MMPAQRTSGRPSRDAGVRTLRVVVAGVAALLCAACPDFTEPDIPNRHIAAQLNINLRVFDIGRIQVDGTLSPGRDSLGFQRAVQSPFVYAAGFLVEPQSLTAQGVRVYSSIFDVPPRETEGPFELIPPSVQGAGVPPSLLWHGLRRLDPDTLRPAPGSDLVLHMDTLPAMSTPPIGFRQWFLDIRSGTGVFRISGDGAPPLTLRIPAEWVPQSPDGTATINMIYFQTGQLRSPSGSYVANVTLDTRLNWVVRYAEAGT